MTAQKCQLSSIPVVTMASVVRCRRDGVRRLWRKQDKEGDPIDEVKKPMVCAMVYKL